MLNRKIRKLIETGRESGWICEPDAKSVMKSRGFDVPASVVTDSPEEAVRFLNKTDGPVVVKAVSKKILHKTEYNAVVTGIRSADHLDSEMARLMKLEGCETVLVEEMINGIEVIIGAKNDFQFGPVVVFGLGGTAVEVYNDTAIRMAPLKPGDIPSMVDSLKAAAIIKGHRGRPGVNMDILTSVLVKFSRLVMDFEDDMASVDLNPVICTQDRCVIADARIILNES